MAYTKQSWHDAPTADTPLSSSRILHLEDGLFTAAAAADAAATAASNASAAASAASSAAAAKYTKPANGILVTDLATSIQVSLSKADSALQVVPVTTVAGRTGDVVVTKADVGLSNVDNTTDANKPISSATQTALDLKATVTALNAKASQASVDLKAPLADPTFTGTVTVPTPTATGAATTKAYVDAAIAAGPGGGGGGATRQVTTINSATAIPSTAKDYTYFLAAGALPTLPTAASNINRYTFKNTTGSAIPVAVQSGQTLEGASPYSLISGTAIDVMSDGTNWRIV